MCYLCSCEFVFHYIAKYKTGYGLTLNVLEVYLEEYLVRHMASRVGIENWESEAVTKWLRYYFGAKKLPYVITHAKQVYDNYLQKMAKQRIG